MSSLVKLSISGVRSYDNRGRETLTFSKPLTLISGPNGVGKTTIIEALKYATTGDMPPNSRGGAFIHDPKMSGERQVLGQVKLGYYNARGQQMVVTRSMQLTMQKKNSTFKTLDGQLLIAHNGQKETLSSRCADLDVQVPLSLGVSTPVLNYVIFCHQEDSMWPLSEPALVKKRFDEIFEATKYSKALDAIKTLRKDYTTDIKLQQQTVEYLHQDNQRATRMAAQIDQLTVKIQNLEHEAESTKTEMDSTISQLDSLFKKNQDFQKVISELNNCRHTAQELDEHIKVVATDLETLDDPNEVIEEKLQNFDSGEAELQQTAQDLLKDKESKLKNLSDGRQQHTTLTRQRGVLESKKASFDKKQQELQEAIENVSASYKMQVTRDRVVDFLEQRIDNAQRQYVEFRATARKQKEEFQQQLDMENSKKFGLQNKLSTIKESLEANNDESRKLAAEVQQHTVSGAGANSKYHESVLGDLNKQLEEVNSKITGNNIASQIESTTQNIAVLRQKQEQANNDLIKASTRFNENSRIMVLKENLRKKQFHISDLTESLKSELVALGKPGKALAQEFEEFEQEQTEKLAGLKSERDYLNTQHEQIKAQLQFTLKDKANVDSKLSEVTQKMESAGVYVPNFKQSLKDVEEDLEIATQNFEQTSFSTQYYEAAKSQASEQSKCILCQRKFQGNELTSFLTLISSKISSIPITKEDATASFEETRKEAEKLRALVSDFTEYTSLKERAPEIETSLTEYQQKDTEIAEKISGIDQQVETLNRKANDLKPLRSNISELERIQKDAAQLESEISDALTSSVADDETPQQVKDRLAAVNRELGEAESTLTKLKEELSSLKQKASELQNAISKKQLDLKNLELQEQSFKLKKAKIEELKRQNEELENSTPQFESKLASIQNEIDKKTGEQAALVDSQNTKEQQLLEEKSRAEKLSNTITSLIADADEFGQKGVKELEALDLEVKQIEQRTAELEQEIKLLESAIQQNDRKLVNSRGQKRVLQDNLQLRKYQAQLASTKETIQNLEQQNAESEREEFERLTSNLQQTLSDLTSSHSLLLGQIKSLNEQKETSANELASDYADINTKYLSASTKLDCTKAATDDLLTYSHALDGAIMKYHSIKMEEINQVLDELWKDTYMGTDIDTIMIKSETESTKTRTTHNYRVVMFKQGVELDMRGRCSAGQKLLACVLIRLALSECFGLNCGFLVLDEPTTNLDVANIQSLGKSLCRIIDTRRVQKNFQLIVITHDEHFLQCLGASNFCDTFFRLHRDPHQHSRIEELPITQLG